MVRLQAFLMAGHLSRCPLCRQAQETDAPSPDGSIRGIGMTPAAVAPGIDLWSRVERELVRIETHEPVTRKPARSRKWAVAAAAAGAVIVLALLLPFNLFRSPGNKEQNKKITIHSATIENRPAKTIYFQPGNKDRIIVWVNKT